MSRQHNFPSRGVCEVEMYCDECEKREWVRVTFDHSGPPPSRYAETEDPCLADLAEQQSGWRLTHDAYVCSQECAEKWWAYE